MNLPINTLVRRAAPAVPSLSGKRPAGVLGANSYFSSASCLDMQMSYQFGYSIPLIEN